MKKFNRDLLKLVIVTLITVSAFASFNSKSEAANSAEVLTYWETISNTSGRYESAHQYKVLSYVNGYTYKQTSKEITTWGEKLFGSTHYAYYRTYSTY